VCCRIEFATYGVAIATERDVKVATLFDYRYQLLEVSAPSCARYLPVAGQERTAGLFWFDV
jgi:hypothetical protein